MNYGLIRDWSIITVYRDDKEYWRGFVKELSTDFFKNAEAYCLEDLGWLNYESMGAMKGKASRQALLQLILDYYNELPGIKGTEKEFMCGAVYFGGAVEINYEFTYDDTLLSSLRKVAGEDLKVRVRRENGKRYIDLLRLDDFPTENVQDIQFGYNLLNFTKEMNTSYMLNVIYPYGAEVENTGEENPERVKGDTFTNEDSIAKRGRIAKNIIFDGVTDKAKLNEQAQNYLLRNAQPRFKIVVNALDMSELGTETSKLDLGDLTHIIAEPYDVDQNIRVTEFEVDLIDISRNEYTLSDSVRVGATLTEQTIEAAEQVKSLPTESDILKAAQRNAVNMLTGVNGGFLNYIFNDNGQMVGFQITDSLDPETATKKWVWNENGLGFLYKDKDGVWQTNNAMTKDGQIVAERITTGTLTGQTIEGATIRTLEDGSFSSEKSNGSKVDISGGALHVITASGDYVQINTGNDHVDFGGARWGCYYEDSSGGHWRWIEPKDLFAIVNDRPWESYRTSGLNGWYLTGATANSYKYVYFENGIAKDYQSSDF